MKKGKEQKNPLDDRELRVMKSLYQDQLPSNEYKETMRRYDIMNELSNKIMLE
jgi:hypothetical protein